VAPEGAQVEWLTEERCSHDLGRAVSHQWAIGLINGCRIRCRQEQGEPDESDTDDGDDRSNDMRMDSPSAPRAKH
jgi:hypothetical protein